MNFRHMAATFVDMDHLLSGTTYDKAPRGRAITIGCTDLTTSIDVAIGTGQATLLGPERHRVVQDKICIVRYRERRQLILREPTPRQVLPSGCPPTQAIAQTLDECHIGI